MGGFEIWLELGLIGLLGATLVHAIRLQRAIQSLRAERASLDDAVAEFDSGARQAETGLARLREAANRLSGEMGDASALKDDLVFLSDRGAQVADRLEALVRGARGLDAPSAGAGPAHVVQTSLAQHPPSHVPVRSQAERDLLLALQGSR